MARKAKATFDARAFLARAEGGVTVSMYRRGEVVFTQGDPADSIFLRMLHDEPKFSELFTSHLLARTLRVEEDLVDQLFNSSEKRLARALLLLANFGKDGRQESVIAKVSQETLADMVGTTRSRVSHFMNKFRQLGYINYNGDLQVHSSLLDAVLHEKPQIKVPK